VAEFAALGPGAWSWFADPRALFHAGAHRRTYVGWLDTGGNVRVAAHDHDTDARTVAIVRHGLGIDDHGNPALLLRHDGRLQVFYSAHNGSAMHYRIAQSPEDVSAWGPERSLGTNTPGGRGFTYPNPARLRAELDRIHLFWRGGDWEPAFSTSLDGLSWAPARTVIDAPGQRPYVKVAGNGEDRIHVAFTDGHPRNTPTSIYYARYRNGAWSRANAQHICTVEQLPFAPHQADVVYDVTQRRFRSWVHDVAFDAEGRPLIVFAIFRSPTDHHYHYARWTGSAWEDHFVTAAGGFIDDDGNEVQYSGGITFDHEDPQVVYLSRQVNGQWEIERWRTADGGRSFTHTAVTAGSPQKNVRPITPRNQHEGDLNVLWMRGSYRNYRDYNTTIVGDPSGGWESPFAEATATPAAGPPPLSVMLDGTSSGAAAGSTITGWEWDFGDGTPPAAVAQVEHTYNASGAWWPRLTVTNQDGATDTIAIEVNVEAA
jgi:hypothetical protein